MSLTPLDVVLYAGLTAASYTDMTTGKIRNHLTFPMMAAGLILHTEIGRQGGDMFGGLRFSAVGLLSMFALHYALFSIGIEKGGDGKLFMAVGALLGFRTGLEATLVTALVYLPVGLTVLAVQGKLGNLWRTARWMARGGKSEDKPPSTELRTAPIIAVGTVLAHLTDLIPGLSA